MKSCIHQCLLVLLFVSPCSVGVGALVFDESVNPDLSGTPASPTVISLDPSLMSTIVGQVGANGNTGATNGSDADYFTFTVPIGQMVTAFTVDSYVANPSSIGPSFIGYRAAAGFPGQAAGDIDAFTLISSSGNLITNLGGPWGPGDHSIWVQETGAGVVDYQFTITAVPEPSAFLFLSLALTGLAGFRRYA